MYISIVHSAQVQRGASMVEFLIATPLLLYLGMSVVQLGLIYHAKSILNYATFEAARTGAVNNAQVDTMRKELGFRMAPVFGGDGSLQDGSNAIVRSVVIANDPSATSIEILNPTAASFAEHGELQDVTDNHGNRRQVSAIPNSHLRVRNHTEIKSDGLNIQDANLLKIRTTFGYQMRLPVLDMRIPGMDFALRSVMMKVDPDNWMYYIRGMLPLQSTATVRMQSESWDSQLPPPAARVFDSMYEWTVEEIERQENRAPSSAELEPEANQTDNECNENGLSSHVVIQHRGDTECHQDSPAAFVPKPEETLC